MKWICRANLNSHFFPSSDINECDSMDHGCDMLAECVNTDGSFMCICLPGYKEQGDKCVGKLVISISVLYCPTTTKRSNGHNYDIEI